MYKLLIADDEKWIRQGLLEAIDWKAFGIDEVWEAEDGGEALQKIQRFHPDIVITDVRMPDIDGLDLTARIKENSPQSKVIIISGYQDFDYARKAVSLGVSDYIVKPLNEQTITAIVGKCLEVIKKERSQQKEYETIQAQLQANSALLQQKYFNQLLNEGTTTHQMAVQKFKEYGLVIDAQVYLAFAAEPLGNEPAEKKMSFGEQEATKLKLLAQTQEWISGLGVGTVVLGEGNTLVYGCLGLRENLKGNLEKEFQKLFHGLAEELHLALTIFVSQYFTGLDRLLEAKEQVEECRRGKFFLDKAEVILYRPPGDEIGSYQYKANQEEAILNAVCLGDYVKLKERLGEMAAELFEHRKSLTEQDVKVIYEGLLEYICREIIQEVPMVTEEFTTEKLQMLKNLKWMKNLSEVSRAVENQLCRWIDQLDGLRGSGKRKIIQAVLDYVETFYNQKITLASAAEYIHFNPSYLSKLFCMEIGEPFTKYVMKIRIQKAKKILKNPLLKVYEVGEQVGYSDIKYFTKIFKEMEGMTPTEYRESCLPNKTKIVE